jgi:hypothetical protein
MTAALAKVSETTTALSTPLSAAAVRSQVNLIQEVMREVMREGEHFGRIPGCGDKPALLKAGAEKLGLTFRLAPTFKIDRSDLPNGHREYAIVCTLTSAGGDVLGEGVGCCSTMESKYRWRGGSRLCPNCQKPAIKKSKYPPRNNPQAPPGFYCFAKVGGCGCEYAHDDPAITSQSEERQENPDVADSYNTVLKMAKKRAHVDAILTATAASDIFTQDVEEQADAHPEPVAEPPPPAKKQPASPPSTQPKQAAHDGPTVRGILRRLTAREAELVKAGRCADGELMGHVSAFWAAANLPAAPVDWSAAQTKVAMGLAADAIKEFEDERANPVGVGDAGYEGDPRA